MSSTTAKPAQSPSQLAAIALLERQLMVAAFANDHNEVRRLVQGGVNINARNASERTALMIASSRGHINVVRELLQLRANPNARDAYGHTSLMDAALFGRVDIVRELLAAHADCNTRNGENETPLSIASRNGHAVIVRDLLAAHADPNIQNIRDETPLYLACLHGDVDIVRDLLAAGANPSVVVRGKTLLDIARLRKLPAVVKLLEKIDTSTSSASGGGMASFVNEGPSSATTGRKGLLNTVTGAVTNCFGRMCGRSRPHQNRTLKSRRNRRQSTRRHSFRR